MLQGYVKGTDVLIVGTDESVLRTCKITGFSEPGVVANYDGDEVHWDTSEQRKDDRGQPLYIGDDGESYPEDQIEYRDDAATTEEDED